MNTKQVIESYKDMVYRIALTHTCCKEDANDAFQESFLVYVRKSPQFIDEEHLKAWLIKTTINCSKQVSQSSWKQRVELEDTMGNSKIENSHKEETFEFETDKQNEIFSAISVLPNKYRTVLHLFYFEDLPVKEIAKALELDKGTVKVQLSRGRDMLRETLKEWV